MSLECYTVLTVNCDVYKPPKVVEVKNYGQQFIFTDNEKDTYDGIIYKLNPTEKPEDTLQQLQHYYNLKPDCFVVIGDRQSFPGFFDANSINVYSGETDIVLAKIPKLYWTKKFKHVDFDYVNKLYPGSELEDAINSINFLPDRKLRLHYIYLVLEKKLPKIEGKIRRAIGHLIYALKTVTYQPPQTTTLFENITLHEDEKYIEIYDTIYQYPKKKIFIRDQYEVLFQKFSFEIEKHVNSVTGPKCFLLRGHPGIGKTSLIYYFIARIHQTLDSFPILVCKGRKGSTKCDFFIVDNKQVLKVLDLSKEPSIPIFVLSDTYNYDDSVKHAKVIFIVSSPDEKNYDNPMYLNGEKLYLRTFNEGEMDDWAKICLNDYLRDQYFKRKEDLKKYGNVTRHVYNDLLFTHFKQKCPDFPVEYWKDIYVPTIMNVLAENGMTYFTTHYVPQKLNIMSPDPINTETQTKVPKVESDTSFSHYILTYFFIDRLLEPIDGWSDIVSQQILNIVLGMTTVPVDKEERKKLFDLYNNEKHTGSVKYLIWVQLLLYDLFHPRYLPLIAMTYHPQFSRQFDSSVCIFKDEKNKNKGFVVILPDIGEGGIKIIGKGYIVSFTTKNTFPVHYDDLELLSNIHEKCKYNDPLIHYIICPGGGKQEILLQKTNDSTVNINFDGFLIPDLEPQKSWNVIVWNYRPGKESGVFWDVSTVTLTEDTYSQLPLENEKEPTTYNETPTIDEVDPKSIINDPEFMQNLYTLNNYITNYISGSDTKECITTPLGIPTPLYSIVTTCQSDKTWNPVIHVEPYLKWTGIERDCYKKILQSIVDLRKVTFNSIHAMNFLIYGDEKIGKTTLCLYLANSFLEKGNSICYNQEKEMYYAPRSSKVFMKIEVATEISEEVVDIVISDNILIGEDDFSHAKSIILVTNKYDVEIYKTFRSKRSPIELYIPFLSDTEIHNTLKDSKVNWDENTLDKYKYFYGHHPYPFFDIMYHKSSEIQSISVVNLPICVSIPSSSKWNYSKEYFVYQVEKNSISKIDKNLRFRSKFYIDVMLEKLDENEYLTAYESYNSQKSDGNNYEICVIYLLMNVTKTFTSAKKKLFKAPNKGEPTLPLSDFLSNSPVTKISLLNVDIENGVVSLRSTPDFPSIDCVLRYHFVDILIQVTLRTSHDFNLDIYNVFHYLFHRRLDTICKSLDSIKDAEKKKIEWTTFCNMIGYIPIKDRIEYAKEYEDLFSKWTEKDKENNSIPMADLMKDQKSFSEELSNWKLDDLLNYFNNENTPDNLKCEIDDYLHKYVNCLFRLFPGQVNIKEFKIPESKDLKTFSPEFMVLVINANEVPVKVNEKYNVLNLPRLYDSLYILLQEKGRSVGQNRIFFNIYTMELNKVDLDVFYEELMAENKYDVDLLAPIPPKQKIEKGLGSDPSVQKKDVRKKPRSQSNSESFQKKKSKTDRSSL